MQNNNCNFIHNGCGSDIRGSPQCFHCKACHLVLYHTGPYGNIKDCKVQQFIGVPLLKLSCNSSTLCGEDQVDYKLQESDKRSHQDSWSTMLNSVTTEVNIQFIIGMLVFL